jgi:hypothetical protein
MNEEFTNKQRQIAKKIARFTNRVGKEFVTANAGEREGLTAALLILNQAQSLVAKDEVSANKLLATARRVAQFEGDDED